MWWSYKGRNDYHPWEGLAKCEYKTGIKFKCHIQLHPPSSFEGLACLSSTCKEVKFGTSHHFDNAAGLWLLSISVSLHYHLTIWKFCCLPRHWCNTLDPILHNFKVCARQYCDKHQLITQSWFRKSLQVMGRSQIPRWIGYLFLSFQSWMLMANVKKW